ncbi:phosphonate C-P lyase system protein PhnH [Rhizobium sp. CFBP 13726]|uniref:phosphonate C-P lyase system protein PhnH n=1 Tax=Rhizobium sp. CFBP 13726 TaxID=2775296 RepID=UPI0017809D51|nr:phosphonate C-P lyase system protein PhnH [Rhizobium sp. CFBP 13726]MBD8652309.1 phosphonate C-P lyase system protein PhnH [Rhizobium sp. CFBP 13726]
MAVHAQALAGGFTDPVFQSQTVFKTLMDGMARPGTIYDTVLQAGQPEPLGNAAGAIALTLCDHDTPVWLSAGLAKSAMPEWIGFHTGAPITREKAQSSFAFIEAGTAPSSLGLFAAGTQEYPDRSTTLIIEVSALGGGEELSLTGPGILGTRTVAVSGLPDMFGRLWDDNRALFPRGVDVILTAGAQFLCLPRTTRIAG